MIVKWIFDRVVSLLGLLILWPVLLVVAILIKVKMPGGPVLLECKDGKWEPLGPEDVIGEV